MNDVIKNSIVIFFILTTSISVFAIDKYNYWIALASLIGFILACMIKVRFNPAHPVTWYLPFVFIYNLSIVLLDFAGIRPTQFYHEIIICTWLAILTSGVLLLYFCHSQPIEKSLSLARNFFPKKMIQNSFLKIALVIFALTLCAFYNYVNLSLGLLKADTGQIWYFTFFNYYSIILTTLFCVIYLEKYLSGNYLKWRYFILLLAINLFTSLNTGERDMFFSFIVSSTLMMFATGRLSKRSIFTIGTFGIILIPIMGALKSVFIRTEINVGNENIFVSLLSGEFISAGRNLETLLLHDIKWDYFYGKTFLWDIRRVLTPGFGDINYTSITWFAETFHWREMQVFQGRGFSLLGEGFINFSYIGVVIIFSIVALLLSFLYNRAHKNSWSSVYYFMSMPYFIYALRADLANIFSPLYKRLLLIYIIILLLDNLLQHLKNSSTFPLEKISDAEPSGH